MSALRRFLSNRHLTAGLARLSRGRHDEAVERLERALAADAANLHAGLHLAQAHAAAGRFAEALDLARSSAEAAPEAPAVLILAGEVCFDAGEEEEARGLFLRALKANPWNRLARAYATLTRWRLTGDDAWARKLLERGVPDSSGFIARMLLCAEQRFRTVPTPTHSRADGAGDSPLLPFLPALKDREGMADVLRAAEGSP